MSIQVEDSAFNSSSPKDDSDEESCFSHDEANFESHQIRKMKALKIVVKPCDNATEQELFDSNMALGASLFFDNQLNEARALFKSKSDVDPLYSLGQSCLEFMNALVSFSPEDIKQASEMLEYTEALADAQIGKYKKSQTISQTVFGLVWSKKNEAEESISNGLLRAHVVKAEVNLIAGALSMLQESFLGLLKAGWRIRRGYKSYAKVWSEYQKLDPGNLQIIDKHTRGAVQFGIGVCNVLLASLPGRVLSLVSILGIKGNKELGFSLVHQALKDSTIRSPLASTFLMINYGILSSFAPVILGSTDTLLAEEVLGIELKRHPKSTLHLYLAGRAQRVKKELQKSNEMFQEAIRVQDFWKEIHYLSYYELALNSAFDLNWKNALFYMTMLAQRNSWSQAFYQYFIASCHVMLGNRIEASRIYYEISGLTHRTYGGRILHIEQYVSRKANYFLNTEMESLIYPGYEIIYIWNGFCFMDHQKLQIVVAAVENAMKEIERWRCQYEVDGSSLLITSLRSLNSADNSASCEWKHPSRKYQHVESLELSSMLHLMRGVALRELGNDEEAEKEFNWIFSKDLELLKCQDSFVVPFCWYEFGILKWKQKYREEARKAFFKGSSYSGFSFENRLALRFHLALGRINDEHAKKGP